MLKPQGYITVSGPHSFELDTITCGHCNRVVMVKPGTASMVYLFPQVYGPPKEEAGAGCSICRRSICLTCYELGTCLTIEARIEKMEAHGRLLKAVGTA